MHGSQQEIKDKIRNSIKIENGEIKQSVENKSQELGAALFQASVTKLYGLKDEIENPSHSHDFNPDSLFGSHIHNTQNLIKKDLKIGRISNKDEGGEYKKAMSDVSFNILENDDKSDYNFLKR